MRTSAQTESCGSVYGSRRQLRRNRLIGVACHALDGERSCAGTLASTEYDPEREPKAR